MKSLYASFRQLNCFVVSEEYKWKDWLANFWERFRWIYAGEMEKFSRTLYENKEAIHNVESK